VIHVQVVLIVERWTGRARPRRTLGLERGRVSPKARTHAWGRDRKMERRVSMEPGVIDNLNYM